MLQALHHAPPLHLHQASAINSVKNKMCSTSYLPLHFARLQENLWNHFQVIERAHVYDLDHYWQCSRAVTPKAGNSELLFLCFANCIRVMYVCIKFQENISNSFPVTEWTQIHYRNHYLQSPKGIWLSWGLMTRQPLWHNSKSRLARVMVLVFYTLSHDVLHLCEVSSKYLEWFSTYKADIST